MTTKKPTLKTIAAKVDKWYQARKERLEFEKQLKPLKEKENELKLYLIDNISKSDSDGVAGKLARVTVGSNAVPIIEDYNKFQAYIIKTKRWELAQVLKPSAPAIKEIWEAGKTVPGIGKFNVVTLNHSKTK